jgi:DNA-binding IclR family transcriptional regulator
MTMPHARAHDVVLATPGITVGRAAQELRISHSTATYHLHALVRQGLVETVRDGRQLRHYPRGTAREAYLAGLLQDRRKRRLVQALADPEAGRRTLNQTAHEAGLPFGAAKRIMEQLVAVGLLRLDRRGFRYEIQVSEELRRGTEIAVPA